jgi:hypothetical protein
MRPHSFILALVFVSVLAPRPHMPCSFPKALHFRRRDDSICLLVQGKCAAEEVNITIVHVKGAMCSPVCGVMDSCPKDVPAGVTVVHALLFPSLPPPSPP